MEDNKPHRVIPYISETEIRQEVSRLGNEITAHYHNLDEPLLLVGVLKGASLFLADLVRNINRPLEYDFVAVSSYGRATETSGEVRVLKDLDIPVAGKHVLIVEDILDTGLTLRFSYLIEMLEARHALSVGVCALLDKPARRKVDIKLQHRGFSIENKFVVGYGMDFAEQYRNLPFIGVVEFTDNNQDLQ